VVLTHLLFVTLFYLLVDVVGPSLLNASLLLVLMTDYSDWLVQVTELIDSDGVFWVSMTVGTRVQKNMFFLKTQPGGFFLGFQRGFFLFQCTGLDAIHIK